MRQRLYFTLMIALLLGSVVGWQMPSFAMNVPLYGQGQSPWAGDQLGHGCGSTNTIGRYGCAITSTAMVLKYYGVSTDPRDLNNYLNGVNGGYGVDGAPCYDEENWSDAANRSGGTVTYAGENDWELVSADLNVINGEIDSGYPVIAEVRLSGSKHFVVITAEAEPLTT